jgi:general secretion pathway protein A
MYTSFYNLKEKPFELTPSPRFLYLGENHKEALALLTYGVMDRKGFVLLTGEVGTGKTTIVQTLINNLNSSSKCVYLSNPLLSSAEFLFYVASRLGFIPESKSKASFLVQFQAFLTEVAQNKQIVLLIVDEAQKLSFRLLEEIRLLSNMETADQKLINIFLVGQPELNEKLINQKCRPLLQRISIRYHINPLNFHETEDYIRTRLKTAGANNPTIFSKEAIKLIHEYARGYPRMINVLCDNALLLGYSKGKRDITAGMIKECYGDLQLPIRFQQSDKASKIAANAKGLGKAHQIRRMPHLRLAVLGLILIVLLSMANLTSFGSKYVQTAKLFYAGYFNQASSKNNIQSEIPIQKIRIDKKSPSPVIEPVVIEKKSPEPVAAPAIAQPMEKEGAAKQETRVVMVKPGDTLLGLSMEIYGYADEELLKCIQSENPEIKNVNIIEVGQRIVFPKPLHLPSTPPRSTYSVHIASFKPLTSAQSLFEKLIQADFDSYILPFIHPRKGKMYRIAIGSFEDKKSAEKYGKELQDLGMVDYAKVIRVEMR